MMTGIQNIMGLPLVVEPEDSGLRTFGFMKKGQALLVNMPAYGSERRIAFYDQEDLDEFKEKVKNA